MLAAGGDRDKQNKKGKGSLSNFQYDKFWHL
jgi:hypothetical protein